MNRIAIYIFSYICLTALLSCNSFLTIEDPEDRTIPEGYFITSQKVEQAVIGVYVDFRRALLENRAWLVYGEVRAGDIILNEDYGNFVLEQNLKAANKELTRLTDWEYFYDVLNNANWVLNLVDETKKDVLSDYEYQLFKGEALALKSLAYFYLYRIWGSVPSAEKTNFGKVLPKEDVINLSIDFAQQAAQLLPRILLNIDGIESLELTRYRMNSSAIKIILAEQYLWIGNHNEAYAILSELQADLLKDKWASFGFSLGEDARTNLPQTLFDRNRVVISIEKLDEIYPEGDTRRKFFDISKESGTGRLLDNCQNLTKLITLNDYYLLLSEAAWRTERFAEAKTVLSEVANGATEDYLEIESSEFKQSLLNERRRLLIGSGVRFFDLVRFNEVAVHIPQFSQQDISDGAVYWPLSEKSLKDNSMTQFPYWQN
jgi:hypothetical protein